MKDEEVGKNRALAAAMEGERRRLGELLHDQVCQSLAGASLVLQGMEQDARQGRLVAPGALEKLKAGVDRALEQIRGLAVNFEEPEPEAGALMEMLARLCEAAPGCRFLCERPVFVHDSAAALALCRVAEEALNNALRHARAVRIVVELRVAGPEVVLEVRDDGSGFQLRPDHPVSSGIGMMRVRSEAAGGALTIKSQPGRGTTVRVTVLADGHGRAALPPEACPGRTSGRA